jgi:hypothetical protein
MSDFWSKKFGAPVGATVAGGQSGYHSQLPGGHVYAPPPTVVVQGNPKAPSSRSTITCPECGSGNYTGSPGDSMKMIRCYDCGYNPRFGQQSGAAGIPAGHGAPAQASRQVSTTNNYQPTNIIGHVG